MEIFGGTFGAMLVSLKSFVFVLAHAWIRIEGTHLGSMLATTILWWFIGFIVVVWLGINFIITLWWLTGVANIVGIGTVICGAARTVHTYM